MSEQPEPRVGATEDQAWSYARFDVIDLVAFVCVLLFTDGLTLLAARTSQLPVWSAFVGAGGLVTGYVTAWRRLRRLELRRWRSGQAVYLGSRVRIAYAWGVEGQPPPLTVESTSRCRFCASERSAAFPARSAGTANPVIRPTVSTVGRILSRVGLTPGTGAVGGRLGAVTADPGILVRHCNV